MDALAFFTKGLILGFSIAAPVGPIGILCIRRTLTGGVFQGVLSGLGAAVADACYGTVAVLGVAVVGNFLKANGLWLRFGGSLFLLYLGYAIFRSRPPEKSTTIQKSGRLAAFASTFGLTLTNPMTILSFAAIFAGLGAGGPAQSNFQAFQLVIGVFFGSLLWWLCLACIVGSLRSRFDAQNLIWVNRIAGVAICAFGLFSLAAFLLP